MPEAAQNGIQGVEKEKLKKSQKSQVSYKR
jgi:hypothetical protein